MQIVTKSAVLILAGKSC